MKDWKGMRTLLFNLITAILTVVIATNWSEIMPPKYVWFAVAIVNFANMALRLVTTTPAGQATPLPLPKA
jgi:hypothetical protein